MLNKAKKVELPIDALEVKKLLTDNKFNEAFKYISSKLFIRILNAGLSNELMQHQGNYKNIQKNKRMGLVNDSDVLEKESKLRSSLFEFIDLLFEDNSYSTAIILDIDFKNFGKKKKEAVIKAIAEALDISVEEVIIKGIESGSVKLNLKLSKEKSEKLKKLFEEKNPKIAKLVDKFNLTDVQDYQSLSDQELLLFIKNGDVNSTKTLYERYIKLASNYLLAYTDGDYQKANALYNDTFIWAINTLEEKTNPTVYKTYLFGALKKKISLK